MWKISKGTILLPMSDGMYFHPSAAELYEQKDNDSFFHADIIIGGMAVRLQPAMPWGDG